ncbi:MAG TPA: type I secretion system permease/ATPase [Steroidobacteraceae bacterium]|nr:type I secretion system permease/ATPase [Steroidobacteraceae bacterium]
MNNQSRALGAPEAPANTGLWSVLVMAALHGVAPDEARLVHEFGRAPFDTMRIILAARLLGLKARAVQQPVQRLHRAPLPAVARDKSGRYFVLAKYQLDEPVACPKGGEGSSRESSGRLLIQRPGGPVEVVAKEAFLAFWSGELILFASRASVIGAMARFDFSWFIPAIVKYRKLLGEILLISLTLQVLGLVMPLFFQVVMDKVLVNRAMNTLNVIAIGLICAILFEALLTAIRTWVFAHTSSKLDVELGARLFRHLLALPLTYFHARRVGDSVARVRELEHIRSFLTGNAMTVVLDAVFSVLFLGIMTIYSPVLTAIVLASIPLYASASLIFVPMIRRRLNTKFDRGAENQSLLVETISGIDTVKAAAVEPRWAQRWEGQLAAYVTAGLSVTNVTTFAGGMVTLISKLVTVATMWVGAGLVVSKQLTVGELIAFNMLSGQVSSPILRIAQLWNDFQQIGVSMSRLGDILNAPPETSGQKSRMPRLVGAIEFDQVSFRYRPETSDVLRQVSLKVSPGEIVGIVGHSGSGKSTLTKLVQRLYVPERGRVLIDGQDISIVDTASLRQQIGVVMQENTLFNRSIRENIALVDPAMDLSSVIEAARLAGAHEFICELPEGYDSHVGEHGVGLSGGQRQRIAIARALISDPRILIFDEATSALDYESESVIQRNMRRISHGRTVLIIAHRLSAVRDATRIVVLERGQIVESGSHERLLGTPGGIYARLYALQQRQEASAA